MSTTAPREPKTNRKARTRTVEGVVLTAHAGDWLTPDGQFVFRYDEHDRAWVLARIDGLAMDWGTGRASQWTLVRSLKSGVRTLRHIGIPV